VTRKHPPLLGDAALIGTIVVCYAVGVVQLIEIFNSW
jgi:hypothetical protein